MISNVYNYYMAEYGSKPYNKHSIHKKSELRDIYNNIVKINKLSPFFDVDVSEASQKRAIDIKENANSLLAITDELSDAESGNMTFKSIAQTSNDSIVKAEYIGENKTFGDSPGFTIEVEQLASPQVNTGKFLSNRARNLFSGKYSFDVNISSITYELQFSVKDEENNLDIQNKLSRLINKSNIGLNAEVISTDDNRSALKLTSNMTGVGEKPVIFTVTDNDTNALSGVVDTLGLDQTTEFPGNAVFKLNGDRKTSSSNNFTVDRQFEITLLDVSEKDDAVKVGLKQNLDSLIDSLHELVNSYNSLTTLAREGTGSGSGKLYSDLINTAASYEDVLASNGLSVNEMGLIEIDDEKLKQSSEDGELLDTLSQIGKFKNALQKKAQAITLNPMEYINKAIVSYKNPARPSADPYTTSIYSGMMYNGYC